MEEEVVRIRTNGIRLVNPVPVIEIILPEAMSEEDIKEFIASFEAELE